MSGDTAPLTQADLKLQQRLILWAALGSVTVCAVVLAASYFLWPPSLRLPSSLTERMAFAIQTSLILLAWLLFAARKVSGGRFHSAADNRGSAYALPSPRIAVRVAFMQNTLEQVVMATLAYVAFATVATPRQLATIVAAAVLFSMGRIAFLIGYPKGAGARAFGMATTAIPTVVLFVWTIVVVATSMGR